MCQLDQTYIGGIERGERNVALVNIEKFAPAALAQGFLGSLLPGSGSWRYILRLLIRECRESSTA